MKTVALLQARQVALMSPELMYNSDAVTKSVACAEYAKHVTALRHLLGDADDVHCNEVDPALFIEFSGALFAKYNFRPELPYSRNEVIGGLLHLDSEFHERLMEDNHADALRINERISTTKALSIMEQAFADAK